MTHLIEPSKQNTHVIKLYGLILLSVWLPLSRVSPPAPPATEMSTRRDRLNGYLVLQGNTPLRTSQSKHSLKLVARRKLGTSLAK